MYFELLEPDRSKSILVAQKKILRKIINRLVEKKEGGKAINSTVAHQSLWIPSKVIVI